MLFGIFYNGTRKFYTADESCIPPLAQLKQMVKDGYTVTVDGKKVKG